MDILHAWLQTDVLMVTIMTQNKDAWMHTGSVMPGNGEDPNAGDELI